MIRASETEEIANRYIGGILFMKEEELLDEIACLREQWRQVRTRRLEVKEKLLDGGASLMNVRRDRGYRDLRKRQRHLSRLLLHRERILSRMRARAGEKTE